MSIKLNEKNKAPRSDAKENCIFIFRAADVWNALIYGYGYEYFFRAFLI